MKDLMSEWLNIKSQENELKQKREELEAKIYSSLEGQLTDSSSTWHYDNFKLSIKPNFSVNVNQEMAASYPELFKTKYEMTYSQYNKCESKSIVDNIVVIKQIKPTFKVEMV